MSEITDKLREASRIFANEHFKIQDEEIKNIGRIMIYNAMLKASRIVLNHEIINVHRELVCIKDE